MQSTLAQDAYNHTIEADITMLGVWLHWEVTVPIVIAGQKEHVRALLEDIRPGHEYGLWIVKFIFPFTVSWEPREFTTLEILQYLGMFFG